MAALGVDPSLGIIFRLKPGNGERIARTGTSLNSISTILHVDDLVIDPSPLAWHTAHAV